METCEDVGELARELGVRPRCLYKWRRKLEMVEPGQEASRPDGKAHPQVPLEAAYHKADDAIQQIIHLLKAA
jgi:transposase-like protein